MTYSISLNNKYKASSIFYPHIDQIDNSNNLKSLAGLAGINLNENSSKNIPSNLYPLLISSPTFKIKILNKKIYYMDKEISFREYLNIKNDKFSLNKIITNSISFILQNDKKNNNKNKYSNVFSLTDKEYKIHNQLEKIILLNVNEDEGFIELSVIDEDPYVATQIAMIAEKILQDDIINFKIKNIKATYDFTKKQVDAARVNFYLLQDSLARFRDNNKNIKSDLFKNQLNRIESEYILSKSIYNELSLSKEKNSIDVERNTPIFTIIKPVFLPNKKNEPNRFLIIFFYSLIGTILSSFWIILKN